MRKKLKSFLIFFLLLALALPLCTPLAELKAEDGILEIRSKGDWLRFAENCRIDSYSAGLSVSLKTDLDLTGEGGIQIPIFRGTFEGGGHSITGIWLEASTDTMGLFRVLGPEAVVSGLTVYGGIRTDQERLTTGLLCGENQGLIQNAKVYGSLKSYENVGAIAGKNAGTIENCTSFAQVEGTWRTGGIAGHNEGEIRNCTNRGPVNPSANEASVNTGGIVGLNEGNVLNCVNQENIGYLHTGYNVGGITGNNKGFLEGSVNHGAVLGRRDVGGISGQMEPSFRLEYGKNAMALLSNSVSGFSDSLNSVMALIENAVNEGAAGLNDVLWQIIGFANGFSENVSWLFSQMGWVDVSEVYIETMYSELQTIKELLPGRSDVSAIISQLGLVLDSMRNCEPIEYDSWLEELMRLCGQLIEKIHNIPTVGEHVGNISTLFQALSGAIAGGFQSFGENSTWILEDTVSNLSDIRGGISDFLSDATENIAGIRGGVSEALSALSALQASAEDVLNGKNANVEDLSSQILAKEKGMIVTSENQGAVSGDYNIGGILGNLSAELSLDQESDALPSLDDLLFTDTTLFVRATVYSCRNSGELSAKYDYVGGIAGFGTRGGIISCENSGNVKAERNYAGGNAGYFRGTLESDSSIGTVSAASFAGGIAGEGKEIRYCRAIPQILSEGANTGAIAGRMDSGSWNAFVSETLGGVNEISYAEIAYPISYEEMISSESVPQSFRNVTIRFLVDGEEFSRAVVPYGSLFPSLPEVPEKDGKFWKWEIPEEHYVCYSETVEGEWGNLLTTIATGGNVPEFLAEGAFDERAFLKAESLPVKDGAISPVILFPGLLNYELSSGEAESHRVTVENSKEEEITVRWHKEEEGSLYVGEGTSGKKLSCRRDGKYLVFPLKNGGSFTFVKGPDLSIFKLFWDLRFWLFAALFFAAVLATILVTVAKKRKGKDAGEEDQDQDEDEEDQNQEAGEESLNQDADEDNQDQDTM